MMQLIDYFKIASKLNEITGYSLLGGVILLWLWVVYSCLKSYIKKQKN